MKTVVLGRTGLEASVIGLGCGGPSRLGQSQGKSEAESIEVVRRALDLGINFIDTAEAYGTQPIVGKALRDVDRDSYILSTKKNVSRKGERLSAQQFVADFENSLRELQVETVDIFHLHGVKIDEYDHAVNEIVPALMRLREQGKIRWLGITESFGSDTRHEMLHRAIEDDYWDVMMVGFNLLNQTARDRIFPATIEKNIGTLIMFAVRRALSNPERLQATLTDLIRNGEINAADLDMDAPLAFATAPGVAASLTEAAYRFCRDEPGAHVVLSGTGNVHHLEENAQALNQPPLPPEVTERLRAIFAGVDSVSGS